MEAERNENGTERNETSTERNENGTERNENGTERNENGTERDEIDTEIWNENNTVITTNLSSTGNRCFLIRSVKSQL